MASSVSRWQRCWRTLSLSQCSRPLAEVRSVWQRPSCRPHLRPPNTLTLRVCMCIVTSVNRLLLEAVTFCRLFSISDRPLPKPSFLPRDALCRCGICSAVMSVCLASVVYDTYGLSQSCLTYRHYFSLHRSVFSLVFLLQISWITLNFWSKVMRVFC